MALFNSLKQQKKFAYTAIASSLLWVLMSQASPAMAQAGWSGSSNICQSQDQLACTIASAVSGHLTAATSGASLTINSGASLTTSTSGSNSILVSGYSGVSIVNHGFIDATKGEHAIAVKGSGSQATITTDGTMNAKWHAISVENSGSAQITVNSGAHIQSVGASTFYFDGSAPSADQKSTFENSGRLTNENHDIILIGNNGTGASGTAVESVINRSGGAFIATSYNSSAVYLFAGENTRVEKIENQGYMESWSGIYLRRGKVGNVINSGTIVGVGYGGDYYWNQQIGSAIVITTLNAVIVYTDKIENTSTGKLLSSAHAAISVMAGRVGTITNAGYIESTGEDGIRVMRLADVAKIENQSGGQIIGYTNGINLITDTDWIPSLGKYEVSNHETESNDTNKDVIVVASGSSVTGKTHAGINFVTNKPEWVTTVFGSLNIAGEVMGGQYGLYNNMVVTGNVKVSGTLQATSDNGYGIYNEGTLGGIEVTGTGNIGSLYNTGTISGDVVLSTSKDTEISNLGQIKGELKVNGTGNVYIKDWTINVVPNEDPNANTSAKAEVVKNISLGKDVSIDRLKIEHITINSINQSLLNSNIDISTVFEINGSGYGVANDPNAVSIGALPSSLGFDGYYDPQDKTFYTSFNVAQTAGAVVSQTLANQLMRRDFFLESAITEAATGSLYHRKLDGVEGTAFVKPYASKESFNLSSATMDGTTQGVMLGINRFVGRHLLTGFVGYERSEIDSNFRSSSMNLDVQSWYGGFNTAHLLQAGQYVDTFLKGSLKASYTTTGIDRSITLNANTTGSDNVVGSNASMIQSSAKPNTVAVGMNVQMGMNFKPLKETQIIPMVGLGYSIGKTSSYQLDRTGLINDAYMPERVMMPYADASVTWFQGWGKIVRTFVGAGSRYILDRTQKTALSYGKLPIEGEYSLPQSFQYVNASMVLHITHHSEIAVGYTGVFDSTGHSQNLTTKYELHF